jgi:hypothetical protein
MVMLKRAIMPEAVKGCYRAQQQQATTLSLAAGEY